MIKTTATLALAYITEAAALKEMLAQLDSEQIQTVTQQDSVAAQAL